MASLSTLSINAAISGALVGFRYAGQEACNPPSADSAVHRYRTTSPTAQRDWPCLISCPFIQKGVNDTAHNHGSWHQLHNSRLSAAKQRDLHLCRELVNKATMNISSRKGAFILRARAQMCGSLWRRQEPAANTLR